MGLHEILHGLIDHSHMDDDERRAAHEHVTADVPDTSVSGTFGNQPVPETPDAPVPVPPDQTPAPETQEATSDGGA